MSGASNPPPAPQEGRLVVSYLKTLVQWIKRNRILPGKGVRLSQTSNGITLSVSGFGDSGPHPWQVSTTGTGTITLYPGNINSIIPTNMFSELSYAGTGLEFVVLDTAVSGNAPNTCTISVEVTEPDPNANVEQATGTAFADVLALINDGTVYQIRRNNLVAESRKEFSTPVVSPSPGEYNLVDYYRWVVTETPDG